MLATLAGSVENALFFAGDLGQRIFREPFSWLALGVDIRGRSQTLKVNYRTSHQIRQAVDKLLPATLRDVDEIFETERHLFYVACTRARDRLLVSGVEPASDFFADLDL